MLRIRHQVIAGALAIGAALTCVVSARNGDDRRDGRWRDDRGDGRLKTIFVVAMENHNWTQPSVNPGTTDQQIFNNVAAPYINSLVHGTSGISDQVSYATNYQNAGLGIHPSEPNYIWAEAGTNFGVANDDTPYWDANHGPAHALCDPDTVQNTTDHLTAYLTRRHRSWRSYQEDTDVDSSNNPLAQSLWTAPLFNSSGSWAGTNPPAAGFNAYYYTHQFNYAAKHNPMVYFVDTSGGCNTTPTNTQRLNYAPLQQLALDLEHDTVADYNWITPNQFNDQHTPLTNGYGSFTADQAAIAQGDNFLSRIVPLIMSSKAYKDGGAILLWWDESEGGDSPDHTLPFIVISKDAHKNVNGLPYASAVQFSHSSTLRTMQEVFDVDPDDGFNFLNGAVIANDLRDLFRPGVIKQR